jgi:hypothetical protein
MHVAGSEKQKDVSQYYHVLDNTRSFLEFQAFAYANICKSEFCPSVAGPQLNKSEPHIGLVATYGAESWTWNRDVAKQQAAVERNALRRINEEIKVNENWRRRNNEELLQMFGDLDILSFVRISRLNWIGHINGMDTKRNVRPVLTIILMEVD